MARARTKRWTPPRRRKLVPRPYARCARGAPLASSVSVDLLRRQVTLVGSWTFSKQGQAECAEFVSDRNVDVEKLFTHRWKLEQAEEAYKLFDTQTTGKAVILPS